MSTIKPKRMFACVISLNGNDDHSVIKTYSTKEYAWQAYHLLSTLSDRWGRTEDFEPEDRHELYDEFMEDITRLGLLDITQLMFDNEECINHKSVVLVPPVTL